MRRKKPEGFMLRQRLSEVTRPPYALHVGLGVFQTIGYPPNWLFSRGAHDNVASVDENCIVNMAKFPGIRASNQRAAKAYSVACNARVLVSVTAEDTL